MSNETYSTSLYVASLPSGLIPTRVEVRKALWDYFKQNLDEKRVKFSEEQMQQFMSFNETLIEFRVKDVPPDKLYLLSFLPTGEDVPKWFKAKTETSAQNVLSFCDLLGSKIAVKVEKIRLDFERTNFSGQERIDISEWEVNCLQKHPSKKELLRDFISKRDSTHYEHVYQCIPSDNSFYIFTDTYQHGGEPLSQLKNALRDYGDVSDHRSLKIAKEFGEKFVRKKGSVFVFLENEQLLRQWYRELKIFFDTKRIPTQYVRDATISDKMKFPGVKANLLLEILSKMGRPPLILLAPEEIFVNDGFLCLSDITSTPKKLFGALFTYSKQGLGVKEEVQIYEDIDFVAPSKYSIEIPEQSIDMLARKVGVLIGRQLRIDILLTKTWKQENVEKLVESLSQNKIETQRVYHISSRACRFVDEYYQSNSRSFSHPYLILGDKIGFLRTSTETRIYPHLFCLYVELIYPENGRLTQGDMEKILWLVKKRIYRIQEFHVLKRVEPICIFSNIRKMYIGDIKGRLSIPLRLLI